MAKVRAVSAFAPASVANVAVGFDIMGYAFDRVGDTVRVERDLGSNSIVIEKVTGVVNSLPRDPAANTATAGLIQMLKDLNCDHGLKIRIKKGIPLSSGMGGSAASAVAAAFAVNRLLGSQLKPVELLPYILMGEAVASGAMHADNVAPSLLGGLVLVNQLEPFEYTALPVPAVTTVLVHPHMQIDTKEARRVLKPDVLYREHLAQTKDTAAFIAALYEKNLKKLQSHMVDHVVEPQRQSLIPGFSEAKDRALKAGAIGFSISGAGPSVFAWCKKAKATRIKNEIRSVFQKHGLESDAWISPITRRGARFVK